MQFKLIMAFVDEDKTETVLDAARATGATGATIITNARGQGLTPNIGIFGFEILYPRDVVLVLVEHRRADVVLDALLDAGKLDESLGSGVAIMLDVDKAVGLSEHIKKLEIVHPPEHD